MPDESAARKLWRRAKGLSIESIAGADGGQRVAKEFHIPAWLEYETGPFAHQGRAVTAWLGTGGHGILTMATGSGKTLTSLIACWKLQQAQGPLLIVIAAPYVPLVMQWCDEVALFGLDPVNLSDGGGPLERRRQIAAAGRRLAMGLTKAEALVVSPRHPHGRGFPPAAGCDRRQEGPDRRRDAQSRKPVISAFTPELFRLPPRAVGDANPAVRPGGNRQAFRLLRTALLRIHPRRGPSGSALCPTTTMSSAWS